MDNNRFDLLTRTVSTRLPRRTLASALGLGAFALPGLADAKKKRKKKKVTFNDFGCVNVGNFCKTSEQCCSGICKGKKPKKGQKDKRRCGVHNVDGCPAGADYCGGTPTQCGTSGTNGSCFQTTGQASFCSREFTCVVCTKDADCEPDLGPGAACMVCALCSATGYTGCVEAAS